MHESSKVERSLSPWERNLRHTCGQMLQLQHLSVDTITQANDFQVGYDEG